MTGGIDREGDYPHFVLSPGKANFNLTRVKQAKRSLGGGITRINSGRQVSKWGLGWIRDQRRSKTDILFGSQKTFLSLFPVS